MDKKTQARRYSYFLCTVTKAILEWTLKHNVIYDLESPWDNKQPDEDNYLAITMELRNKILDIIVDTPRLVK